MKNIDRAAAFVSKSFQPAGSYLSLLAVSTLALVACAAPGSTDEPVLAESTSSASQELVIDPCQPAVRTELESIVENVRQTYAAAKTTGWSIGLVRRQSNNLRCVISGSDGFARSAQDPQYRAYTTSTRQNIASVSKVFMAASILDILKQKGMGVDTPIWGWLPSDWDFTNATLTITFRHLLSHTSGLGKTPDDLASIKSWFANATDVNVGNASYSNAGYVLLQYLFARLAAPGSFSATQTRFGVGPLGDQYLSGLLFEEHIRQNYLLPFNIKSPTAVFNDTTDAYAYPQGSRSNPIFAQGAYRSDRIDHRPWAGTGGISASARDVAQFLDRLHNDELFEEKVVTSIETNAFGYDGWAKMPNARDAYLKKGGNLPMLNDSTRQFKAMAFALPSKQTYAVLTVNDTSDLEPTFQAAWEARTLSP